MAGGKTPSQGSVIIIKRIKKGDHGHHGGAWKVAYADFVTAMMAFFLLLWLLNVTTDVERKGIADYFAPASISKSDSGAGGVFGGQTPTAPGAMINDSTPISTAKAIPEPDSSEKDRQEEPGAGSPQGPIKDTKGEVTSGIAAQPVKPQDVGQNDPNADAQKQQDEQNFKKAEAALKQAIKNAPGLQGLEKNLIIDSTPEGLRIQIVDRDGYSLFSTGSAILAGRSRELVSLVGLVISKLPNRITVTGHTDNTPFPPASRRNNWQLSSERAQSSLEAMMGAGVASDRLQAVIGKADREPLVANDLKNSQNRRISIVLLRRSFVDHNSDALAPAPVSDGLDSAPVSPVVPPPPVADPSMPPPRPY
jgi:chemotaxis protein MotB